MNKWFIAGALLFALGTAGLVYEKIGFTTRETAAEIGPIEITRQKEHAIPVPPLAGALAIAGGLVLMFAGSRRATT